MSDQIRLIADTEPFDSCLASLKHFLDISLEVRERLIGLGNSLAKTRSINVVDGATSTCEVRVFLEPSDGLAQILAACLAGDIDDF